MTLLTAGFFLLYLVAIPPHLVHHLFDEDHGQPACPHLAASQQSPELASDPPALVRPVVVAMLAAPEAPDKLAPRSPAGATPRAPPTVALSA